MIVVKFFLLILLCYIPVLHAHDMPIFLIGTWKVNGKNTFEQWYVHDQSRIKGHSYQLKAGKKQVTENIEIYKTKTQMVYSATVLNQNNGKSIDFVLDSKSANSYVFVNQQHDFPNSISYKFLSDEKVFVEVLGNDGNGFSYEMHKHMGHE